MKPAASTAAMIADFGNFRFAPRLIARRNATYVAMPRILPWEISRDEIARPAKGSTDAVVDTPAGMHGRRLEAAMKVADTVVVPLQASLFDMQATHAFLRELRTHKRADRVRVGLVAMRVKEHTIARERLQEFVATLGAPLVASLRDTQNYVHLAAHGLTLFDVAPGRVERDLEQFEPLARWLEGGAPVAPGKVERDLEQFAPLAQWLVGSEPLMPIAPLE